MMLRIDIHRLVAIYYHILCLLRFLLSPQTKFGDLLFLHRFFLLLLFFCLFFSLRFCPTDSDFFGLSRSTRRGSCSYQISAMIFWVFFNFFNILAIFMATAAILKKNQPLKAQLHMAYDISTRFHKVWSRHLREMCRTIFWRRKKE
jgi:hypothetical protein